MKIHMFYAPGDSGEIFHISDALEKAEFSEALPELVARKGFDNVIISYDSGAIVQTLQYEKLVEELKKFGV